MLSNKTIVLFGGSGLLGSAIKTACEKAGADVFSPPRSGLDITDESALREMFSTCPFKVDGVVNAAFPADPTDHTNAFFNVTDQAIKVMGRGGSIVNIGSIYGHRRPDDTMYRDTEIDPDLSYWETKSQVHLDCRLFAVRAAPDVRVNVVAPGGIWNGHSDKFVRAYCDRTPMNRMANAADVTGAVTFLLSDAASYITGQCLYVAGGFEL